jgi:IS4 transposase
MLDQVFDGFVDASPVSVMFRGTLENIFSSERLNAIFEEHAEKQISGELAFSTCAELLSLVTTRIQPSVHAAYIKNVEDVGVAVNSVYNKLKGIELPVSEALVRETAVDIKAIIEDMNATLDGPLPGYDVRIVDGNHLAGTDHRIQELRALGDAPLPGHTVAVLNPHVELIEDLIACEDGHANQKPLYLGLLDRIRRDQCWIADRDYCTTEFLFGIQHRRAYFIIRQHGVLQGKLLGRRKRVGETETGIVYEQQMQLTNDQGEAFTMRRITVVLNTPTRDGDREIHLLTNLPQNVDACRIATAYRSRWTIETAFAKLTQDLRCELNTLGYPKAALFSFCVAVVMYNALSTVIAAMRATHPEVATSQSRTSGRQRTFSFYYLANEISGVSRGMAIAIPAESWTSAFSRLTTKQMAKQLLLLARRVDVKQFLTNPYGPKTRKAKPKPTTRGRHVSTYRILQQRKKKAAKS